MLTISEAAGALLAQMGVTVQSVQKVPISLLCKINSLEGDTICYLNKINDFLRLSCNTPVYSSPLPR